MKPIRCPVIEGNGVAQRVWDKSSQVQLWAIKVEICADFDELEARGRTVGRRVAQAESVPYD